MPKSVVRFNEIDKNDVALVGNSGAALGEMAKAGFLIPNGFIITSSAFHEFIRENKLDVKIKHLLSNIDFNNEKSLGQAAKHIKKHALDGKIPEKLVKEIVSAYNKLGDTSLEYSPVTVSTSAITENISDTSFFKIKGDAVLLEKIKQVWAAFLSTNTILKKHDYLKIGVAIVTQKTVKADTSGVMLTIDATKNDKSKIVIEADSKRCEIRKSDYTILSKKNPKISDNEIIELAKLGEKLEKYYYFPQSIEWAIQDKQIYILKTKPVTMVNLEINKQDNPQLKIVHEYYKTVSEKKIEQKADLKTATKLYVNLAEPEMAAENAQKNIDGVGLLQAECMISKIGIHPKKMIRDGKSQEFINILAGSIAIVCKAFAEKPVIYRTCNFKTNEYRNLIGGREFEPQEVNPILGFRGAFRYIHDSEVFKLELEAIKIVRDKMGYKNLLLMLPFVRTVEELIEVKKMISKIGLDKSPSFKLWMVMEIPSNVIMLEKFIETKIDGISINLDHLSMLIMGADRNNFDVAGEFNQTYPAVVWALESIVKTANKFGITSSIFGPTLTSHSDLIRNLMSWGISSISVLPDEIDSTRKILAQTEKELLSPR